MADWIALTLIAGCFLGLYDIAKKTALKENAVPPVLLISVSIAALIWIIPLVIGLNMPVGSSDWKAQLSNVSFREHILLLCKSVIVGASWACAFHALKHLPLSVATPIRATSPLFTILFAVTLMGESPNLSQWGGITIVLAAVLAFSRAGAKEGIVFHRDRYIALMVVATLLGAASALYDKHLLQTERLPAMVVQAWFSIYLVPVVLPLAIRWWRLERRSIPFAWSWCIPLIAISLLVADYFYFAAIASDGALISIISPLRRVSVVIPFLFGIVRLKEQNWASKLPCIIAILIGTFLISRA